MTIHILLIDDDKDELLIFNEAIVRLPEDDYKITYAGSVQQALETLSYDIPDYLFVDYNMPGENGLQFIESLKANEQYAPILKYIVSTSVSENTRKRAAELGCGCIQKTTSVAALADILRDIFAAEKKNNDQFVERNNF